MTFSGNTAQYGGGANIKPPDGPEYIPQLTMVNFISNSAVEGGGLYIAGNVVMEEVNFSDNDAEYGGGMVSTGQSLEVNKAIFSNNDAKIYGGGLHNYSAALNLTGITFSGNTAVYGGGIYHLDTPEGSQSELVNVTFSDNIAMKGAGVYSAENLNITNATFAGNFGKTGAALFTEEAGSATVTNSIFWGNHHDQISGPALVTYSTVQGGCEGEGNITADPRLGSLSDNGGFTLTRLLGANSPAIDTGNLEACPLTDQRGQIRPVDGDGVDGAGCDMGAYEYYPATGFTLTVQTVGGGSVRRSPDKPEYLLNEEVTLTPVTLPRGGAFLGWGGDASGNEVPLTVTITGDMEITANFVEVPLDIFVFHVKPDSDGNCVTWQGACELGKALSFAEYGDQIWVSEGTYTLPHYLDSYSNVVETFAMINGVSTYGGFVGDELWLKDRDSQEHLTILSGNSSPFIVVTNTDVDENTVFDGFTVTDGSLGMEISNSDLTVSNCAISNNDQGMDIGWGSDATIHDMVISENGGTETWYGGGVSIWGSNPLLTDVTIIDNVATQYGGGMAVADGSYPILTNVAFISNEAYELGGGFLGRNTGLASWSTLNNVTFSGNSASSGGAMYVAGSSCASGVNVTFYANDGGAILNGCNSPTSFVNSIFWGNTPDQIENLIGFTPVDVTYSDIQGDYEGEGNVDLDPLLEELADNGGFTPTHALGSGSPAIDTGSPTVCPPTDQRGYVRPIDGDGDGIARCDMGAYEFNSYDKLYIFLPIMMKQ